LQAALKEEQIIVEEKKAKTDALIVSIGQEKAVVDEAVESSRDDENQCATLQVESPYCATNNTPCGLTVRKKCKHFKLSVNGIC